MYKTRTVDRQKLKDLVRRVITIKMFPTEYSRDFVIAAMCGNLAYFENLANIGKNGSADEQYRVAQIFDFDAKRKRQLVNYSEHNAFNFYSNAAKNRHLDANYQVALYLIKGSPTMGLKQDYENAMSFLCFAAGKGHVGACNLIGEMYNLGQGVVANATLGEQWIAFSKTGTIMSKAHPLYHTLYYELYKDRAAARDARIADKTDKK